MLRLFVFPARIGIRKETATNPEILEVRRKSGRSFMDGICRSFNYGIQFVLRIAFSGSDLRKVFFSV